MEHVGIIELETTDAEKFTKHAITMAAAHPERNYHNQFIKKSGIKVYRLWCVMPDKNY